MKKGFREFWEAYLFHLRNKDEVVIKFQVEGLGWLALAIVIAAAIMKGLIT